MSRSRSSGVMPDHGEGEYVAVLVSDDLNFNVPDGLQILFHVQARITEGSLRHGRSLEEGVFKFMLFADEEDAASAAAAFGFQHDGKSDFFDYLAGAWNVDGPVRTGDNRNAKFFSQLANLHLVAKQVHGFSPGADEDDTGFLAFLGKTFVFGGETPPGMDGDDAALLGLRDDEVEIKISSRI